MNKLLLGATVLCAAMVLSSVNRGFDISDEGLYVLLAHPLQENNAGIFNYDLFFKGIYQVTGIHFGIIGLRILRLLIYAFGALFLSVFWKNIHEKPTLSLKILLLSFLGIAAGYGFLPSSLSYNSLSVTLVGGWLACISYKSDSSLLKLLCLGLILGLLVYVKVTTALLLGLISVIFLVFKDNKSIPNMILLVLPFLLLELTFYFFFGTSSTLRMLQGMEITVSRPDYSIFILFKHTFFGFFWCFWVFIASFVFRKISTNPWINLGVPVLILILIFAKTRITEEWNHVFLLIMPLIFGILAHFRPTDMRFTSNRFWVVLLLFLPYILHFGSNVYWLRLGIHYWVFWSIAMMIWVDGTLPNAEKYLVMFISFSSLILVFNGLWWSPFSQNSLWKATEKWEYLPGKSILLSPNQVLQLRAVNHQMPEESPATLLAAYRIPGIPYLLGKTIPKSPGYWDKIQLEAFFSEGIRERIILYNPLEELPDNANGTPILISDHDE